MEDGHKCQGWLLPVGKPRARRFDPPPPPLNQRGIRARGWNAGGGIGFDDGGRLKQGGKQIADGLRPPALVIVTEKFGDLVAGARRVGDHLRG